MAVINPTSVTITISGTTYTVTWVGGSAGTVVDINVFESASGGTPPSGYSAVATSNGIAIATGTKAITGTPVAGYYYYAVVHVTTAAGTDLAGPTLSAVIQNYPAGVLPTFTLTSLSGSQLVVAWSGGTSVSAIDFQTYIADATNMAGNTLFYDPGNTSQTNSGTYTVNTTFTPGYSFSVAPVVTYLDSTTATASITTPGLQLASPTVVTTGGTLTTSGTKSIRTFTAGGTFKLIYPASIAGADYLVVGGGGGGGCFIAGGGGAGAVATGSTSFTAGSYSITVGNGGTGGATTSASGGDGTSSILGSIATAIGGGGGGYLTSNGRTGGSGGGGGGLYSSATTGGVGTQGFNGGAGPGVSQPYNAGGGGGGAGAVGSKAPGGNDTGGAGGVGVSSSISGSAVFYGGGGGGGADAVHSPFIGGAGGNGGGGKGGSGTPSTPQTGTAGTTNTGGGGGGGGNDGVGNDAGCAGGAGGSGIVIIAYNTSVGLNPSLSGPIIRSPVGRGSTDLYRHPGRGMARVSMTDWMDSLAV